jgi:hypothetical protein
MRKLLANAFLLFVPVLAACEAAKPFDYDAYNQRPGVFSGPDGKFVITAP